MTSTLPPGLHSLSRTSFSLPQSIGFATTSLAPSEVPREDPGDDPADACGLASAMKDTMTTGMSAVRGSAFSARSTDQPSVSGIITSSRITRGCSDRASASPVTPSTAVRTA